MSTQPPHSRIFGGGNYQYQEIKLLGQGGFAKVYLVEDNLGRPWALKQIHEDLIKQDPKILERFEREAHIQAGLKHPHIAGVHIFNPKEGYLVIDFIEGRTLKKFVDDDFPEGMDFDTVLQILQPIEAALTYIHEHAGFAHLDITPKNILIQETRTLLGKMDLYVVLADFGLARVIDSDGRADLSTFVGTPGYWAPEQQGLIQEKPGTPSDIYALGVVIGVMLTGRGAQEVLGILRDTNGTLPPILPPAVKQVLQRATDENPNNRYATVKGLVTAFKRAVKENNSVSQLPKGSTRQTGLKPLLLSTRGLRTISPVRIYALFVTLLLLSLGIWTFVQNLPPTHLTPLGGVDLGTYCQSLGYERNNSDMSCSSTIDLNKACDWQHETSNLAGKLTTPSDPDTANCYDSQGKAVGRIKNMGDYCQDPRQDYSGMPVAEHVGSTWFCEQKLDIKLVCIWQYDRLDVQDQKDAQGNWTCYSPS